MESMREIGYSTESAIADLIDNISQLNAKKYMFVTIGIRESLGLL